MSSICTYRRSLVSIGAVYLFLDNRYCEESANAQTIEGIILTDIFVFEYMCQTDALWLMSDRLAIDDGNLELINDGLVNRITLCKVSTDT